ncbi:helix-turn-helix domain-containing GNAT family N-acetyltransferase [Phenylobacterium sp.]|uniref:bifunctional helix-turn-helix transcriptional regulator/GNAT family N-acetyltransferase n=1 Tax=Phenylobacterium sp. TaxID=1871053 RepID=UPI00286A189D|nr:helix-turn-helix domain-containing GNAT family N-acetyltransferase [Phenylobacterium sp.]
MLLQDPVASVRRFNRFYTRRIGALDEAHLGSPYSLAEGRVLYEVAQSPTGITPKALAAATGLDPGYLSRILKRFEAEGLMVRETSRQDARSVSIWLTSEGIAAYGGLRQTTEGAVEGILGGLATSQRVRLLAAMKEIETVLAAPPVGEVTLRPHRVGDMGWVTWRHAVFYAREFGWGEAFEALVAKIAADFIETFDPARERCWIAERGGEPVGSVFLVKGEGDQAKLRLLLVEPSAQGLGLGKRLVAECVAFARAAGYREITLWTQSILTAARGIYAGAGFELVDSTPHRTIGVDLIGETWVLKLSGT